MKTTRTPDSCFVDLKDSPARMARRFNIAGTGLPRRIRDDTWIAMQRIRRLVPARPGD